MMRHLVFRATTLALVAALSLSLQARAAERTGELLKGLLKELEDTFDNLEQETTGFQARAAQLRRTLDEKARAFAAESEAGKKHVLRAEAYQAAAQLNQQERKEVLITLRAIGDVRDKVGRIRGVLEDSGIVPRKDDLARFQKDFGRFGQSAITILDKWSERAAPESRAELDALKVSLARAFSAWETSGRGGSDTDLQRTVRTLDVMYSQLLTLQRALEVEKSKLQIRNEQALIELILLRLGKGGTSVSSMSDGIAGKQRELGDRQRIVDGLDAMPSAGIGNGSSGVRGDDAERLGRIRSGQFFRGGK